MANLRIEFFQDERGEARGRDPIGGVTLVVTGVATSPESRAVVPAAISTGDIIALFESDAPVYIDVGDIPDPANSAKATLVLPGTPVKLVVVAGDRIAAIIAPDIGVASGGIALSYVHTQPLPALNWAINHNLGFRPIITLLNSGSVEIEGEIVHISDNLAAAIFVAPVAGTARCL